MRQSLSRASKEALFCIGSNCGDRKSNVIKALDWLEGILLDFRHSPIYITPDCHGGQREYMNAVCKGSSELPVGELERLSKQFEISLGRDAQARTRGDVPVDIDIVVFDGKIMRERDFESEFFRIGYMEIG